MILKCKERRIAYLSGKGGPSRTIDADANDEAVGLCEEVAMLRKQLEATPTESIKWMINYKKAKARAEEMEADAANKFDGDGRKSKMEALLARLMEERDSLKKRVDIMSDQQNVEIGAIIKDVAKLEAQIGEKERVIAAGEDRITRSKPGQKERFFHPTSSACCRMFFKGNECKLGESGCIVEGQAHGPTPAGPTSSSCDSHGWHIVSCILC